MSKIKQAIISLGIRIVVVAAIAGLNALIKSIAGIGLPDAGVTVPIISLVLSEADTWLVNYEGTLPAASGTAATS